MRLYVSISARHSALGADCYDRGPDVWGGNEAPRYDTLLGGAVTWPLAAHAQKIIPVIGYLSGRSPDTEAA
jgi:hypothetical protein